MSDKRKYVAVPRSQLGEWFALLTRAAERTVNPLAGELASASGAVGYWRQQPDAPDEMTEHIVEANERMGDALVQIGMAIGLPRPRVGVRWGAPEILAWIRNEQHQSHSYATVLFADHLGRPADVDPSVLLADVKSTEDALTEVAELLGVDTEYGVYGPSVVKALRKRLPDQQGRGNEPTELGTLIRDALQTVTDAATELHAANPRDLGVADLNEAKRKLIRARAIADGSPS